MTAAAEAEADRGVGRDGAVGICSGRCSAVAAAASCRHLTGEWRVGGPSSRVRGVAKASADVARGLAEWLAVVAQAGGEGGAPGFPLETPSEDGVADLVRLQLQRQRVRRLPRPEQLCGLLAQVPQLRALSEAALRLGLMVGAAHPRLRLTTSTPPAVAAAAPPALAPRAPSRGGSGTAAAAAAAATAATDPQMSAVWPVLQLDLGEYGGGAGCDGGDARRGGYGATQGCGSGSGGSTWYTVVRELRLRGPSRGRVPYVNGTAGGAASDDGVGALDGGQLLGGSSNSEEVLYGAGRHGNRQLQPQPPHTALLLLCTSQPGVAYQDEYGNAVPDAPFLIPEEVHAWVVTTGK